MTSLLNEEPNSGSQNNHTTTTKPSRKSSLNYHELKSKIRTTRDKLFKHECSADEERHGSHSRESPQASQQKLPKEAKAAQKLVKQQLKLQQELARQEELKKLKLQQQSIALKQQTEQLLKQQHSSPSQSPSQSRPNSQSDHSGSQHSGSQHSGSRSGSRPCTHSDSRPGSHHSVIRTNPALNDTGENYVLLGSTGLTGSQVLQELITPWIGAPLEGVTARTYWCFSRKFQNIEVDISNLPKTWTAVVEFEGEKHVIRKNDVRLIRHLSECGGMLGLKCHWDQYNWDVVLTTGEIRNATLNVVQVVQPDSRRWPDLFNKMFTGGVRTFNAYSEIYMPAITEIETLISTLGSTSWEARKSQAPRAFVDYTLNMQMAKTFAPDPKKGTVKHMVIVTSFNHLALGMVSTYFRTKQRLENDLTYDVPGLTHLTILRPGPLLGEHGSKPVISPTNPDTGNMLTRCYTWKRNVIRTQFNWLAQVKEVGPTTKVTELVAKATYHLPGNWIVGYSIPAGRVAQIAAQEALVKRNYIKQNLRSSSMIVEVTIWSSQDMDTAETSNSA
ncbi:AaceriAGR348Wp [[Ashbya] aceris (nom. inval.)]|nr:AaceriAGR348Wp [[Ashbya] aceris (nom. inval.)]